MLHAAALIDATDVTGYQIAAEDYPYLRMRAAAQRP